MTCRMAVEIYRHRQTCQMAGEKFDVTAQAGDFAAQSLRPEQYAQLAEKVQRVREVTAL